MIDIKFEAMPHTGIVRHIGAMIEHGNGHCCLLVARDPRIPLRMYQGASFVSLRMPLESGRTIEVADGVVIGDDKSDGSTILLRLHGQVRIFAD